MTVLYIDDEANSEAMKSKFEGMATYDLDVIAVSDVSQAMPTLRRLRKSIQCVVLDVIMPTGNAYTLEETNGGMLTGLFLLRDIRAEFADLPVILVSVMPEWDSEIQRLIVGRRVARYLSKPVAAREIAVAVKEASRVL